MNKAALRGSEFSACVNLTRLVEASKGSGGAGWFGIEICKRLASRGFVTVLACSGNAEYIRSSLKSDLTNSSLRLDIVDGPLTDWLFGPAGHAIDVYIDPLNGLEPHVRPAHIASIAVIHDLMFMRDPHVFTEQEIEFRCSHYGDAIRRADLVMTVARREAQDIVALFPDKPVCVVDQPAYFRGDPSRPIVKGSAPILFSPGVQWNHKNHFRLVSAFLQLLDAGRIDPQVRLYLSAIRPVEANHQLLKPLVAESRHAASVIQMPYLSSDKFADFLDRCSGIVLPSLHEGYGIPLIEAVVSGKPILTTRVPSIDALSEVPDFVRFIEDANDISVIANALADFVNELPVAEPRPDLCPTAETFTDQLVAAVQEATAVRRARSAPTMPAAIDVKRRSDEMTLLIRSHDGNHPGGGWDRLGPVPVKLAGLAKADGYSRAQTICDWTDEVLLATCIAHELLLCETRFLLLCSPEQYQELDPEAVQKALSRLRLMKGKAKVRLVDLGIRGAAEEAHALAFPAGLYDLKSLNLPFEARPEEVLQIMEQAKTLYQPTQRRALILDPSLKNPNGHHLAVATALARSLKANGYYTTVACNFGMSLHSIDGVDETFRLLSDYLYEQNGDIGLAEAEFHNAFTEAGVGPDDLVFAFCATPTMLAALAYKLAQTPVTRRPHVAIRFDRPEWRTPPTSIGYEQAFQLIRSLGVRKNFSFTVESKGLQQYFEITSGETFAIRFNHVAAAEFLAESLLGGTTVRSNDIVVSYVGEAREEKGFQHLPGVLRTVLPAIKDQNLKLRIQCGANSWNQTPVILEAKKQLVEMAATDPRIELLEGALPEDEYLALIRDVDIVFLPYFPPQYRIRGSGVATEAAAFGTELVVSHGLDITATYPEAVVTESRDYSVTALAQALLSRIQAIGAMSQEERAARKRAGSGDIADFAPSFLQPADEIPDAPSRIVLWFANDTRGEGSETVYRSQFDFLESNGYLVVKLVAPYPARWRLENPWIFDLTTFVSNGECVANFQPGLEIESVMDDLSRGGDVLANFTAAWNLTTLPPFIERLLRHSPPQLAVVNYAHHHPLVRRLIDSEVPTIVETHDIQALQYAIQQNRAVDERQLAIEMELVGKYDHIVSISKSEADVLAKHCRAEKVTWCMPFVEVPRIPRAASWEYDLLFVGSSHHANVESLRWFMWQVYEPLLHPQGISLAIVGNVGAHVETGHLGSLVMVPGRVPDLEEWYRSSAITTLPIISGAGVPIKVIDAMARGVPFVMTDFPAKAMQLDSSIPVATTPLQFAEQVLACLASADERERRAEAGYEFIRRTADRAAYHAKWEQVLARVNRKAIP